MSQLIIIDIQEQFKSHMRSGLLHDLIEEAKKHDLVFILDSHDGEHLNFPEELYEFDEEGEDYIFDPASHPHIYKQYGFFRNLMDKHIDDEDIVSLGKFMLEHSIYDARDILENEDHKSKFQILFKNSVILSLDFESDTFYIPDDVVENTQNLIKNGAILCGGGLNECLKEYSLLLKILEIEHSINYDLTY